MILQRIRPCIGVVLFIHLATWGIIKKNIPYLYSRDKYNTYNYLCTSFTIHGNIFLSKNEQYETLNILWFPINEMIFIFVSTQGLTIRYYINIQTLLAIFQV